MTNLSEIERLAFWQVYNKKCLYCDRLLERTSDMQIDHLFPKELKNNELKFNKIKKEYGLPNDFDLESFENLISSCGPCNRKKSDNLLSKNSMFNFYSIAKKKSIEIQKKISALESKLSSSERLLKLKSLLNKSFLRPREVVELIDITENIKEEVNNPIVIAFCRLYNENGSDSNIELKEYRYWCEDCLDELINKINRNLTCLFSVCDDVRDGEVYGLRIAFWGLNWEDFDTMFLPSIYYEWDITEILKYLDIWEESAKDLFMSLDHQKSD